jgi:predicted small lipoprotein YifL
MNVMRPSLNVYTYGLITLAMIALFVSLIGCGAVGPPIPPEEVGIEAKVRKQQHDQAGKEGLPAEDQMPSPVEEPVELPAFYPIGTR